MNMQIVYKASKTHKKPVDCIILPAYSIIFPNIPQYFTNDTNILLFCNSKPFYFANKLLL